MKALQSTLPHCVLAAGCAVIRPWEAIVVGATGGGIAIAGTILFDKLKIDDPVGALSVHGLSGIWVRLSSRLLLRCFPQRHRLLFPS